jgi:hypothetical protein
MRTAVAVLVAALGTASSAFAQLQPCTAVDDPSRTKILLDDIVSSSNTQSLLQPLTSRLDANLAQVQAELGVELAVLPCEKRRPSGPSDFNHDAVQQLGLRGVLMEVWGTTARVTDERGEPLNEASVGYVIVPVRLDELQPSFPQGAFIIPHRAKPSQQMDDLFRLVDQGGRLGAYASLALGSRSLRARLWNDARKQLCAAATQFTAFTKQQSSKPQDAELAKYAHQRAAETVTSAQQDRNYNGFLKQIGASTPCS